MFLFYKYSHSFVLIYTAFLCNLSKLFILITNLVKYLTKGKLFMKNLSIYSFYLFVLILMPINIFAQESVGIEEVIVSATKTEANVQDIPMVVDVLTADQIEDMNIVTAIDIGNVLPTLIVNYNINPMNASMRIRGIGTSQSDASLESDVALLVDGVYLNKTGLGLNDLVDIERIEVLQGPQGTLYGKNSNAGVVNITTMRPVVGDTNGFIKIEDGDYAQKRVAAGMSFGLTDELAMRITANINESEGWMTNRTDNRKANGVDDEVIALKLSYVNDDLNVYFVHTDISKRSTCCAVDSLNTSNQTQAGYVLLGITPADSEYDNYVYGANAGLPNFNLDSTLTSINVEQELENGTLTWILAKNDYLASHHTDADFTAIDFATLDRELPGDSISNELRFSSNRISNMEYTIGAIWSQSKYGERGTLLDDAALTIGQHYIPITNALLTGLMPSITQLGTLAAQGLATQTQLATLAGLQSTATQLGGALATIQAGDRIAQDMTWSDETAAIFGRFTSHISDTLRVTAGIRYTREEKDADLYAQATLDGNITLSSAIANSVNQPALAGQTLPRQLILGNSWPLSALLANVDDDFSRTHSATTWSLSAQKDLSDGVMLYAAASTGSKAGGFNTNAVSADTIEFFGSETSNYEIGIKSRLMDNRIQLNATYFDMETEQQQGVTQSPTGLGTIVFNSDVPAERVGYDINLIAKILPNLTLNAGYVNIDDNDPPPLANAENRLAPDEAYNVGLSHFFPFANGMIFSRFDYKYDGEYSNGSKPFADPSWLPVAGYPDLSRETDNENLNLKVGWRNDEWEIAYSVKNATDEKYLRLILIDSGLSGVKGMLPAAPEIHTVSLNYKF